MPWEETDAYVRSGHENPDNFDKESMRTIDIDAAEGIKAVIGCPKGNFKGTKCGVGTQVQSYLFAKEKGWTMKKAKEWFEKSKEKKESKTTTAKKKAKG